ncbi:MAG: hypothetical protein IT287_06295 [Bdellovibrionaceae bacterium]|nr:hypothetical protein [Pseudobdellovibrionaceae bacterium]
MKNCSRLLLIIIISLVLPLVAMAKEDFPAITNDTQMCPISMELNKMEKDAYISFFVRLSHLNGHYGKNSFDTKLNSILEQHWPETKVIETSPLFMERVLNMVEIQYLKNAIASTIGQDDDLWKSFFRVIRSVIIETHLAGTTGNRALFAKNTEKLTQRIRDIPLKKMKIKNLTQEQADILKARAILLITNMFIFLERQSIINTEILALKIQELKAKFTFNLIRYGSIAILVASTMYAGPIIAIAGAAARGLVADVVIASQLAKLGQIAAGGGLGIAGAPVGHALVSASKAMYEAETNSLNNGTVFACELNKKFKEWKAQGTSPFIKAALTGGGLGLAGGALTLTRAGAQIVLYATTFGVGVGQLYALNEMNDNTMRGLAEYKLALMAQENGNNEQAREHLKKSREYFQIAGEKKIEALVISILSVSFAAGDFRAALSQGEDMIRVMYANSSDTLPQAFQSAVEMGLKVAE